MEELAARLPDEVGPDTLVLTHTFRMPGWTPRAETTLKDDPFRTPVYVYRVGDSPSPR